MCSHSDSSYVTVGTIKRIWTYHPKIWSLGIKNTLISRPVRSKRCGRESLTSSFSPEAGHRTLLWVVSSLHPEERSILIFEVGGMLGGIQEQAWVFFNLLLLTHTVLAYHVFPQLSTLHQTWNRNTRVYPFHWVFMSFLCHIEFMSYFHDSHLLMSFVVPLYRAWVREHRRVAGKIIFSSSVTISINLWELGYMVVDYINFYPFNGVISISLALRLALYMQLLIYSLCIYLHVAEEGSEAQQSDWAKDTAHNWQVGVAIQICNIPKPVC